MEFSNQFIFQKQNSQFIFLFFFPKMEFSIVIILFIYLQKMESLIPIILLIYLLTKMEFLIRTVLLFKKKNIFLNFFYLCIYFYQNGILFFSLSFLLTKMEFLNSDWSAGVDLFSRSISV